MLSLSVLDWLEAGTESCLAGGKTGDGAKAPLGTPFTNSFALSPLMPTLGLEVAARKELQRVGASCWERST